MPTDNSIITDEVFTIGDKEENFIKLDLGAAKIGLKMK